MAKKESSGWIKIHRKLTDSEGYFSEPFCRNMAWVDLLILANHKAGLIRKRGVRVELKRGDIGMGSRELADRWKWSRGKVLRFLDELERDNQIVQQKNNITNCITIVNYAEHQDSDTADSTTDSTTSSTTDGTQTGHKQYQNKNVKNVKNDKKKRIIQPISPLLINFVFESVEFKEKYMSWLAHLQAKGKTATEPTIIEQQHFLKKYTETVAIEILNYSLKGGYTTLYEPKEKTNGTHQQTFTNGSQSKLGTSEARIETARNW